MSAGHEPVKATFWLLEAPDSLAQQSRHEPDGTGLGHFDADNHPAVQKQPLAAYEDQQFGREAREISSRTFVAHVRYASTGNLVLIEPDELWALRYPDVHELHVLERQAGGSSGSRHLEHASARGSVRVRSGDLATRPAVIVATEQMDEGRGWQELGSGQLLHVDSDLKVSLTTVLEQPPARPLTLHDLDARAAASQAPEAGA